MPRMLASDLRLRGYNLQRQGNNIIASKGDQILTYDNTGTRLLQEQRYAQGYTYKNMSPTDMLIYQKDYRDDGRVLERSWQLSGYTTKLRFEREFDAGGNVLSEANWGNTSRPTGTPRDYTQSEAYKNMNAQQRKAVEQAMARKGIYTPAQMLRASRLTPEAQMREFGTVLKKTGRILSDKEYDLARSLTEREQRNRFGRVVQVQPKYKSLRLGYIPITLKFPEAHPKAGQAVTFLIEGKPITLNFPENMYKEKAGKEVTFNVDQALFNKLTQQSPVSQRDTIRNLLIEQKIIKPAISRKDQIKNIVSFILIPNQNILSYIQNKNLANVIASDIATIKSNLNKNPNLGRNFLKGIEKYANAGKYKIQQLKYFTSAMVDMFKQYGINKYIKNKKLTETQATNYLNVIKESNKNILYKLDRANVSNKNISYLVNTEQSRLAKDIVFGLTKGFVKFPKDVVIGEYKFFNALVRNLVIDSRAIAPYIKSRIALSKINKLDKKGKLTQEERNKLYSYADDYKRNVNKIKNILEDTTAIRYLNSEQAQLAKNMNLLVGGLTGLGYVLPTTARLIGGSILTVTTAQQIRETIKNPTAENIGETMFFVLPMFKPFRDSLKRFKLRNMPNVKNASIVLFSLSKKQASYEALLRIARKKGLRNAVRDINKEIELIKKARKEIKSIQRDPSVLKASIFNPHVPSRVLLKYQGAVKTVYHVSTSPHVRNLTGQLIEYAPKDYREALRRIYGKGKGVIEQPEKVGNLLEFGKFRKTLIDNFRRFKVVLGGGKAQNLQSPLKYKRFTWDIDGKVRGAENALRVLARDLNKKSLFFKYEVLKGGHKGTFKLVRKGSKKALVELTEAEVKRSDYIINRQGIRIQKKAYLLRQKAEAITTLQRFARKGQKDIGDIVRLTKGKIQKGDIYPTKRLPSNTFEATRQLKGMGEDRLKFDEDFFYLDTEAPLGYAQGKPYSILIYERAKIGRLPRKLRILANKALRGSLSRNQIRRFRLAMGRYIRETTKSKFKLPPRAIAQGFGEREIVQSLGTQSIIGLRERGYSTWDSEFQQFMEVAKARLKKGKKKSLIKIIRDSYGKRPFRNVKLRLTNPDLLLMRKYNRLLKKNIKLSNYEKKGIFRILEKFLRNDKKIQKKESLLMKKIRKIELKIKYPKGKIQIRLKPEYKIKLELLKRKLDYYKGVTKSKISKPLRKTQRAIRETREFIGERNKRVINRIKTELGNVGIRVRFAKYHTTQKIKQITYPKIRLINSYLRRVKTILKQNGYKYTAPIRKLINKIRSILSTINVAIKFKRYELGERISEIKTRVKNIKALRTSRRIINFSKERVSTSTKVFIRKVETSLGNLGIRAKFFKYNANERLRNIKFSVQRRINLRILKIKRAIRLKKEGIISLIKRTISYINSKLKQFNYYLRVKSLETRGRLRGKGQRIIRKIKGKIRIGTEYLSKRNSAIFNAIRNKLGNLGIIISFKKYNSLKMIREFKSYNLRKVNILILKIKRDLRLSKNKITSRIKSRLAKINSITKKYNVGIRIKSYELKERFKASKARALSKIRKIRGRIVVAGEFLGKYNSRVLTIIRSELSKINIRIRFTKYNMSQKIKGISSNLWVKIKNQLRFIKRSYNKAKSPLITRLNKLKFLLRKVNIKIQFIKSSLKESLAYRTKRIIRPISQIKRRITTKQRKLFTSINKEIRLANNTLKSYGIRLRFKKYRLLESIKGLTAPITYKIRRYIRLIKRSIRINKGKITKRIRKIARIINSYIPFEIKFSFKIKEKTLRFNKIIKTKISEKVKEKDVLLKKIIDFRESQRKRIKARKYKPKFRVLVRARTRARQRPRIRARPRVRVRERARQRPRIRARPRVRVRERARQRPRIRARPRVRQRQRIRPRIRLRIPERPPKEPPLRFQLQKEKKKKLKKLIKKSLYQKMIYIPDLQSRIFGYIAMSKKARRSFLRKGRKYTGTETRMLLRG